MKTKITPAILEDNFLKVENYIKEYSKLSTSIQVDVCDGEYVKSKTWLPNSNDDIQGYGLEIEYDMMVADADKYLKYLFLYDAGKIILHINSFENFEDFGKIVNKIRNKNKLIKIGLGVKSNEHINEDLKQIINENKIDYVQIMGIERIGEQGQKLDMRVLQTIKSYKDYFDQQNIKDKYIQIDGGMNPETIKMCLDVGASSFVVGSYLKNSDDKKHIFHILSSVD
jgi:ribulose-phosphate 3-epimerase